MLGAEHARQMTTKRSTAATPKKNPTTGLWGFVVDLGPGLDAGGEWRDRRQARRGGFATMKAANEALAAPAH